MLAHLSDYRNPFVTVELLPKYVEPIGEVFSLSGEMKKNEPEGVKILILSLQR